MVRGCRGGRRNAFHGVPAAYNAVVRLWVLRLLVRAGGHRALLGAQGCAAEEMMHFLGLSRWIEAEPYSLEGARAALRARSEAMELQAPALPVTTPLAKNVAWLGATLNLTAMEQDILHFVVLQAQHPVLERALDLLGCLTFGSIHRVFGLVLGGSPKAIRAALRPTAALGRTGLLNFDLQNRYSFDLKVEMLRGLADRLGLSNDDPLDLFRRNFVAAAPGRLGAGDFPHLAKDLRILETYLQEALAARRKGVNVLIHGVPGTGKTEFCRMLPALLDCRLFEVATEDEDGDPLQGRTRFRSYRLAQAILGGGGRNLVLFDEVEDVFRPQQEEEGPGRNRSQGMKGWINRTLEENPVPALWVTNAAWAMDPAFIRRFDFVLEVGVPPRSVRAKVLDTYLTGIPVDSAWKAAMAGHEGLVPAVVERAAKVVAAVRRREPGLEASQDLARVLGNTLEAMGAPRAPRGAAAPVPGYRPEWLSTDCDLAVVKAGLAAHGQGRLCFYGPPGTGKTAFGLHLAEVLDRPLMVKRASDLQSKWLGETEQNLARMFAEADAERAVLLLDEADTFLQDRKGAQRSWEISQVNELLTQLETFEGISIASTNLMESLDGAALRRFDLKIHFDYLKPEGAWGLFRDTARRLGLETGAVPAATLGALATLTPGDFANVMRQARLRRIGSEAELLARLQAECDAKPEGRRKRLGFQAR